MSLDTLATAMDLGCKIGKISAMAGNGDGFVANRSRTPFGTEMNIMVEEGALPEQVDKVMVDFGYPPQRYSNPPVHSLNQQTARHQKRISHSAVGTRQLVHGYGNDLASLRGGRIRKPKP